jgi:hypothetical protein
MKLVMVLVPTECLDEIQKVIDGHEIHAYTEIPSVLGSGRSGRKLGTRAFPGTSSMLLAVTADDECERLLAAVKGYAARSPCAAGIRAFTLPAEAAL